MTATPENSSDREIVLTRVLHAPRELVWQVWTDPKHVGHWWGPRGFTTNIRKMDFRVGGYWEHTMVGPDGTNYPNKSKFTEIVPLEKITYVHGGGHEEGPGAHFTATWTFEAVDATKTRLTGRMVFPSSGMRDLVVREFGAIEGGRQTLERASEYVGRLQARPLVIVRDFAAPLDAVWRAWTEREGLARWWGPKGAKIAVQELELRPGGRFHYRMTTPDGSVMWGRFIYREIVPQRRLVWANAFSDPEGGLARAPFGDAWALEMYTQVDFAELGGKTRVTVTFFPVDASEAERKVFDDNHPSMQQGWGGSLEVLAACLAD